MDSWFWGHRFPFNINGIHSYIKDQYVAGSRRLDPFAVQFAKGSQDYDEINSNICESRKTYELDRDGCLIHFKRSNMTIQARIQILLLLQNVTPISHTSSRTMLTAQLIWYTMKGNQVDIEIVNSKKYGRLQIHQKDISLDSLDLSWDCVDTLVQTSLTTIVSWSNKL